MKQYIIKIFKAIFPKMPKDIPRITWKEFRVQMATGSIEEGQKFIVTSIYIQIKILRLLYRAYAKCICQKRYCEDLYSIYYVNGGCNLAILVLIVMLTLFGPTSWLMVIPILILVIFIVIINHNQIITPIEIYRALDDIERDRIRKQINRQLRRVSKDVQRAQQDAQRAFEEAQRSIQQLNTVTDRRFGNMFKDFDNFFKGFP